MDGAAPAARPLDGAEPSEADPKDEQRPVAPPEPPQPVDWSALADHGHESHIIRGAD